MVWELNPDSAMKTVKFYNEKKRHKAFETKELANIVRIFWVYRRDFDLDSNSTILHFAGNYSQFYLFHTLKKLVFFLPSSKNKLFKNAKLYSNKETERSKKESESI